MENRREFVRLALLGDVSVAARCRRAKRSPEDPVVGRAQMVGRMWAGAVSKHGGFACADVAVLASQAWFEDRCGSAEMRGGTATRFDIILGRNWWSMDMDGANTQEDPPAFYEAHIFVCCNRRPDGHKRGSCAAAGSEKLRDYMKVRAKEMALGRVRVNIAGCLDRCELGPCLVIYPEGIWYKITSPEDVDAVLERHVRDGGRARELMLPQG